MTSSNRGSFVSLPEFRIRHSRDKTAESSNEQWEYQEETWWGSPMPGWLVARSVSWLVGWWFQVFHLIDCVQPYLEC